MSDDSSGEVPEWARRIKPEEWRIRLLRLSPPLRGAVAAIVYWDVFSVRFVARRWAHIDDLIGRADAVTPEQLFEGLLLVGYAEKRAKGRVWPQQNFSARGRYARRNAAVVPATLSKELTRSGVDGQSPDHE